MRLFWSTFRYIKICEEYYKLYAARSDLYDRIVSLLCTIATAGSAIAWWATGIYAPLWATIILILQTLTLVKPNLPFAQRTVAANGLYKDLTYLSLEAERTWFSFHTETTDFEAEDCSTELRTELNRIELKYAAPSLLPIKDKLFDRAEDMADGFLRWFYDESEDQT